MSFESKTSLKLVKHFLFFSDNLLNVARFFSGIGYIILFPLESVTKCKVKIDQKTANTDSI